VEKPKEQSLLGRNRLDRIIKMGFKERGRKGMDCIKLDQRREKLAGSCKHGCEIYILFAHQLMHFIKLGKV
jgi:hypothetical protein